MEAVVVGQFGVEGGGQERPLAQGDGAPSLAAGVGRQARQHLHLSAYVIDDGGANEHAVEGPGRVRAVEGRDGQVSLEAVQLAAVGVAPHADVKGVQGGEPQVWGPLCQDDEARAGAQHRQTALDQRPQGPVQVEVLHETAQGGALAAGYDEPVQAAQLVAGAHLTDADVEAAQHGLVFDEIALEGQHPDGCHFSSILARCGMYSRPQPYQPRM